jgi:hypothetical protein
MKKTLSLILIISFTVGLVYVLAKYYRTDGFLFAWQLNFLLMFSTHIFTQTLKSPLTSSYFNEKSWEQKGKIYEYFGVNFFRKLLVIIGWEKVIRKSNPIEKNTNALTNLHNQTKHSEMSHLIILFIVLGFNVFVAFKFGLLKSLWLLILNSVFNLYPIFVQRYNRPRIGRAMNLSKRKQTLPPT